MAFRISDSTIFSNAVRQTQLNRVALTRLQNQVSTGRRLNSVSDDPTSATQLLAARRGADRIEQFSRNIDAARTSLEPTESALSSLTSVITRLRELAISADIEIGDFDKIQPEVEQLFDEIFSLAGTRVGGRYLFSGFATGSPPFTKIGSFVGGVVNASAPPEPYGRYDGDNGVLRIQIGEATTVDASVAGRAVFLGSTLPLANPDDTPDGNDVDIFDVIRDLRNRLLDPVGQGPPADVVGDLDKALNQVLRIRSTIGATLNRLDMAEIQIGELRVTLAKRQASLEGSTELDFIAMATELASRENAFQAALAVTARVLQPSLLNFLG